MANTSAIWQQAAHTTYQWSSPSCLTRAIQKSLTLNDKYLRVFWKKVRRMDHQQKNDKTERARGLGRRKKKKRGDRKGNQMTALRFQILDSLFGGAHTDWHTSAQTGACGAQTYTHMLDKFESFFIFLLTIITHHRHCKQFSKGVNVMSLYPPICGTTVTVKKMPLNCTPFYFWKLSIGIKGRHGGAKSTK